MSAVDCVVVGGGFYGCSLALSEARSGKKVLLLEKESCLLQRASLNNQARVHGGYHYPRHFLTALRSRVNLPRFVEEYGDCIRQDFDSYYAIAKLFSKVTAPHFQQLMTRAGAPITTAPENIKKLFNSSLIEDVFGVREYAFDANLLKKRMERELAVQGVQVETRACVSRVTGPSLKVHWARGEESQETSASQVLNCTYSGLNQLLDASDEPKNFLKHEISEICLVRVPEELQNKAITIMCGPFFSIMPFPSRNLHTLSHVRYTPHLSWLDSGRGKDRSHSPDDILKNYARKSHFVHMQRDSMRYIPLLSQLEYVESIWEVKTLLISNEENDGRPILCKQSQGLPGLINIIGGKIDNIYDVQAIIKG